MSTVEVAFDWNLKDNREVWIEAQVSVTCRGPLYSDQRGDFGPDVYDTETTVLAVFNAAGVDISDSLLPPDIRAITDECEERALKQPAET